MSGTDFPNDPFPMGDEAGQAAPTPPAPAAIPAPALPPAEAVPVPTPASFLPPPMPAVGYAGFWIRFVAWILDVLVWFVLDIGAHSIIRLSAGVPLTPFWSESSGSSVGLNCAESLVGVVVWWLYMALSESSAAEATLGKRALRLRVTDLEGRRISFARATGRHFAKILSGLPFLIGFIMAGFTRRRQALHDQMAETVVLRDVAR
jgi:uncharacterized RDD family membrane protein YckC